MKIVNVIKGVRQFYVYNNNATIVYADRVVVGSVHLEATEDDDFFVRNGVLTKSVLNAPMSYKQYLFNEDKFEEEACQYARNFYFDKNSWLSTVYSDGIIRVALTINKEKFLFDIAAKKHPNVPHYSFQHGVLMLTSNNSILFYAKSVERMWEYVEATASLKINSGCIPVVDDVVVVISEDCAVAEKIQGFNIHTGKKLWEISNAEEIVCPNTFFVGEDQYLYGCCTECAYYDEESKLIMTKLNPKNGNTESIDVGMGFSAMSYDVNMHGRQLYYTDNRRGNEIGVIDVDKRELIERMPLNIKKKVTIGAPMVTDDKVYVYIRDLKELRVYEK